MPEPVEGVGPPKLILVVKLNLIILLCINLQSQEEREVSHLLQLLHFELGVVLVDLILVLSKK